MCDVIILSRLVARNAVNTSKLCNEITMAMDKLVFQTKSEFIQAAFDQVAKLFLIMLNHV
jgi:hypothetical protein